MKYSILLRLNFILFFMLTIGYVQAQDAKYVDSLERGIEKMRKEGGHDTSIVNELNKLAYHFWGINPKKNEAYAQQMLQLSQKHNYLKGIARAYAAFGITCEDTGNFKQAIKWHEKALAIREQAGLKSGIADCYNNIAGIYERMGLLNQSLINFLAGLKIYESIHDTLGITRIHGNIGLIYHGLKKYDEEIRSQYKALALARTNNNTRSMAHNYTNLGNAYVMKENYKQAFKNLQAAIPIYLQHHDLLSLAYNYNIIGLCYYNQKDYKNAIIYYRKAYENYTKMDNKGGLASTATNIGITYLNFKDYGNAQKFLQEGLVYSKEVNGFENLRAVYEGLASLDSIQGNYKSALNHYRLFIANRDSLLNKENIEKITQTRMEYEFGKEREQSIAQQNSELRTRNIITIALSIGCVFIVIIALLLFRRSQFMKKVQVQTQKNLEEKEVLLREIHHRVKNNLAVISGLLYLQKNRVSDETIKGVLLEGQNRIDSMVLVHEMLYQSNNIAAIDLQSYLNKLITQIAIGFESKVLTYTIEGTATLEPKQAVPLGLILTELITNIYKYAYPEIKSGSFQLSITNMDANQLLIVLKDNGKGLPDDFDINKSKTLGLKLVKMLCQQMKAVLNFANTNGTEVSMLFSINKGLE